MFSNKSSNTSTPRSSFKLNITAELINKRLKNDLKELEKVSIKSDNIRINSSTKIPPIQKKLPNKIELNIDPNTTNQKQNQKQTEQTQSEIQKQIPTRKYPFLKDEYVSVDELRSRVYHGTMGVYPVRKSEDIENLKFIMKGKPIKNEISLIDYLNQEDDEGINEPNSSENDDYEEEYEENYQINSNRNTPVGLYDNYNFGLNKQSNFLQRPKPAILPSTGTSGMAKFAERPKPAKKHKTVLKPRKNHKKEDKSDSEQQLNETELQQKYLENEVKSLVDEAKKLVNLNDLKSKMIKKQTLNKINNAKIVSDIKNDDFEIVNEISGQNAHASNEKKLLKSVEGLISAIKSGQLLIEQEQSNRRIQEILGNVMDKASLSLFDPSFSEHSLQEENQANLDTDLQNESQTDSAILATEPSNRDSTDRDEITLLDQKSLTGSFKQTNSIKTSAENEIDFILDEKKSETVRSLVSSYEDEIELYLASLPAQVTREDVFNTTAKRVKIFEKDLDQEKSKIAKKKVIPTTEDKFARNLHLFCMLEHERRDVLLLPDELLDVTRKFHTRSKYENKGNLSHRQSESVATINSSKAKFNESFVAYNRTQEAARRVFNNLTDLISFENDKKMGQKEFFDDSKSHTNDSGIGDELDSWRQQAENALDKNDSFYLEAKKISINKIENMREFALNFLKPSPPKMSLRPSRIRENLFPKYTSMPPPVDDLNLLKRRTVSKKFFKSNQIKDDLDSLVSDEEKSEGDDDELLEDSELELQFIIEKQYSSDTDLSKMKLNESEFDLKDESMNDDYYFFSDNNKKLKRSFSDTILNRNPIDPTSQHEFLKIDSNYHDAIQEVLDQKKVIKADYLSKKSVTQMTTRSSNNTRSKSYAKISDTDEEIRRIESRTLTTTSNKKSDNSTSQTSNKYFPKKSQQKSLAEEALENGRNYIITNTKKKKLKKQAEKIEKKSNLKLELLEQIEKEIFNSNLKQLSRCESIDRIQFKPKVYHPDDRILYLASRVKLIKRPSEPSLFKFEEFKQTNGYNESKWSKETDSFYNKEREWVRDIWNKWFDEIIPKLDGTFNKQSDDSMNESSNLNQQQLTTLNLMTFDKQYNTNNAQTDNTTTVEIDKNDDEDEEDENGFKLLRIVKSPTPYSTYSHVNLESIDESKLDIESIKLVEKEISVLDKRLESKLVVFDLVRRGTLYRKLGFLKKSLDDLNLAIQTEPKFVDGYWQRHLVYLVQDRKKEAMEDLNSIIKLNRTHAGAYLSRADLYAERKDYSMAIVNYSQTIKYNPNDYQAYFKRGQMYELKGDMRMAMDDYLTTTKLNPKISEAWFKHGMSYYNNNNWHYAIVDFTEMIKNNPTNQAQARLYRGKCYLNLDEHQLAFDDFCVALHLNPNDWESYFHRGCLLRKLDPKQALQDFSVSLLIQDGYENLKSFLHRGILYSDMEKYDEAIKDFESVLQLDKEYAPAYVNLGVIYMKLTMNYWMAIKQFNLAIKANPVYIRAYLCRAQAYRLIHDLKSAYLDYTKAIHMDPLNTQIYIYRGQVILEMGNLKLAAFCVQHASFMNGGLTTSNSRLDDGVSTIRTNSGKSRTITEATNYNNNFNSSSNMSLNSTNSKSSHSVTQRALVFSFLKNYDKAINILEQELKVKTSTDIYNLLGRVFMKAKRWDEAVKSFVKSIEINFDETSQKNKSRTNISTLNHSFSVLAGFKSNKKDLIDAYFMKGQCFIEMSKYNDAYLAFDKVIDLKPTSAKAYYYRGIARVHLKHQRCIQDFNKALALDPTLFEAFLARACIYGMQNRFTKAILNCNQAVKLNAKSVRGYLYRGALKYLAKSFDYAILDLTEAIKLDQTCVLAYFNRALCYQKIKQFKNALKDFGIVLMLGDYLQFKVLINRGLLYFELKDYHNALIDFKLAALHSKNDYNIQHMIGVCLHKLERYEEAVDKLTETYNINTKLYDALISRGNVYVDYGTEKAFEKALNDYQSVLNLDSKNLDAHINLAYLYQMTARFKLAWQQFSTAIDINPRFALAFEGRSVVCLQMSDTLAALKDINQAIKIKPCAELFVNRGVIYQFMADNVNAMRDYQSAILINSEYGLAYYNSANIYLIHKQYDQALKSLDLAIDKCQMKDESTYQNRAIAKAMLGDTVGSFRDLCEAIKYGKYTAHIFMNRGLLLYKMENFDLALKDFTTAINLSPNDALLYKLRADCRGKLGLKEDAISDYKIAVDLKHRNKLRKIYENSS